jgi:hypothetical protein
MSTLHGWDHRHSSQVPRLWLELIRAHDQIFSEANKALLKKLAVAVSIVGFAGGLPSATHPLGRRAKLSVGDRYSIQFHPVL